MSWTVQVALFGWIPAILAMFSVVPPRRAVLVAFLAGWMFLPNAAFPLPGLPDLTKATASSLGVLIAAFIFDSGRLLSVKPKLIDLPMAVWCLSPLASSLHNGLGAYDGMSGSVANLFTWGAPYYIGRAYLRTPEDMFHLARALFIAGLVYVPLCVYEARMSPRLQEDIYGIHVSRGIEYADALGSWGSRPNVFMGNALAVGLFMTTAALSGFWLWRTKAIARVRGYSVSTLLTVLILTCLLCKNMGALSLLAAGILALTLIRTWRTRLPVLIMVALAPLYVTLRVNGLWTGETISALAGGLIERRGESMQFRLDNETRLVERALQQPVFGWGGWGRARVYREDGKDISVTDGLWVIVLGDYGLVGLCSLAAAMLAPVALLARRLPGPMWRHPQVSGLAAMALCVVVFAIDCLFNAFPNPMYITAVGGVATLASTRTRWVVPTTPGPPSRRRPRFAPPSNAPPMPGFPPAASGTR